jgi:hypothetical protein
VTPCARGASQRLHCIAPCGATFVHTAALYAQVCALLPRSSCCHNLPEGQSMHGTGYWLQSSTMLAVITTTSASPPATAGAAHLHLSASETPAGQGGAKTTTGLLCLLTLHTATATL